MYTACLVTITFLKLPSDELTVFPRCLFIAKVQNAAMGNSRAVIYS